MINMIQSNEIGLENDFITKIYPAFGINHIVDLRRMSAMLSDQGI